ncbi:MAG: hypothetical protein H5T44_02655 [Thermoplasmatales archaeon]|nr:hypothetical protein [Thermoplasmatales archaeon]
MRNILVLLIAISVSLLLSVYLKEQSIAIFLTIIGMWLASLGIKEGSKSKVFWGGFLVSISISYLLYWIMKTKWQITGVIFICGIIVTLFILNSMKMEKNKN